MTSTSENPFDTMLDAYVAWAEPVSGAFAHDALERADLPPRSDVIDVACGTGALTLPAAQQGHDVTGIDLAPGMVAHLNQRLLAYPRSSAQVMDATRLEFADGSFDAAFSIFGVFFFGAGVPDALAEMRRVTRPGGVVAAVHWADPMGGPAITLLARAVERLADPRMPAIGAWGFAYLTPAELHDELTSAGLVDVTVDELTTDGPLPPPEEMLDEMHTMYLNHPNYRVLDAGLRADLARALAAETRAALQPGAGMPLARAHLVLGRRPSE